MHRTPKKTIVINGWKAATMWRELDKIAKNAQDAADEAKAAMLAEAGDAEIISTDTGTLKISKSSQDRIDSTKLRKEYPEVADKVTKTSEVIRVTWKD
jgi:predicted phage-related endonuclease